MKHLMAFLILGLVLLEPYAAFAQSGFTPLATPPLPPMECDHLLYSRYEDFEHLVSPSDIVAFGIPTNPQRGLFRFKIDEHLIEGVKASAVDVMEYNPEHYGLDCAEEFNTLPFNPLLVPFNIPDANYLMTFTVITDNQVRLNAVFPIIDDTEEARESHREQFRQEIRRIRPTPSKSGSIMMIGLGVVAIGSGIAAFIGWKRQQTT